MKKKDKVVYVDDGRTIANMNVEGMPWYNPAKDSTEGSGETELYKPERGETIYILFGILKAVLLIAAIFVIGFLLFILFADFVWLK